VENFLVCTCLAVATLVAIAQVLLRAIFNIHLWWGEETIVYLIIYSTFLGAIITLRHNEHIAVKVFEPFLGRIGRRRMDILGILVTIAYLAIVGFFAPFSTSTVTPTLKLPLWVVEFSVPLGFTLMLLRAIEILVRLIRGLPASVDGDKSEFEREEEALGLGEGEAKL
jgi:TRAP-type C4-dicarboxylate transport system permease small subunit